MGVILRAHPVRGDSHIQRQRRGCNSAKACTRHRGRNEVRWRLGQEASLALFEPEPDVRIWAFVEKIHCIEESTRDIFGTFRRPRSNLAPGELRPFVPLGYAPYQTLDTEQAMNHHSNTCSAPSWFWFFCWRLSVSSLNWEVLVKQTTVYCWVKFWEPSIKTKNSLFLTFKNL